MTGKIGLFILTLLVAAGCTAQPATVMATPPATAATTMAPDATLSEQEALALADRATPGRALATVEAWN